MNPTIGKTMAEALAAYRKAKADAKLTQDAYARAYNETRRAEHERDRCRDVLAKAAADLAAAYDSEHPEAHEAVADA